MKSLIATFAFAATLVSLSLPMTASADGKTGNLICTSKKFTEVLALNSPNADGEFTEIWDIARKRRYKQVEAEQVASDRVDYRTSKFKISLATLGISPEGCDEGYGARIFRKKAAPAGVALCCQEEVEVSL